MKKALSLMFVLSMCISLCVPAFAVDTQADKVIERTTVIIDEETQNADIQRQIDAYIKSANLNTRNHDDYNYIYSYEQGPAKYVTKHGYPGNQPARGTKFAAPGGAFSWTPEGGPSVSAAVSISIPVVKMFEFSVDLGIAAANESLAYVQTVDNYTDYVKLYVYRTEKVIPYVTYRTHRLTGVTEVYTVTPIITLDRFEFEVRVQS